MLTEQFPVPEQVPDQPEKLEHAEGVTVKVNAVPVITYPDLTLSHNDNYADRPSILADCFLVGLLTFASASLVILSRH